MEPYDPNKRYLGPQEHWLTELIPEFPVGCEAVQPYWNKAAYDHDRDYEGVKENGFWGSVKNFWHRRRADIVFYEKLLLGVSAVQHKLSSDQYKAAKAYANIIFTAVRSGGWKFYKLN